MGCILRTPTASLPEEDLHLVLILQATDGSVFAVEAVLQVNPGLANEVIRPDHVMVVDQHREQGLLWERGLDLKWPAIQAEALGASTFGDKGNFSLFHFLPAYSSYELSKQSAT